MRQHPAFAMRAVAASALLVLSSLFASIVHAEDDTPLIYRVQKGDTLHDLGQRYLVGPYAVSHVRTLNRVANPRRLAVGQALNIPRQLVRFDRVQLRVQSFTGPVSIDGKPVERGAVLPEGGEIRTGANGFVTLRSSEGGTVSMPSNSRARLIAARRYRLGNTLDVDFEVLDGRSAVHAPKLQGQERFRIRTPVAVTAVRGTEFRVAHLSAQDRSITEVVEGTVSVASGERESMTEAGLGIAASQSAGLDAPESLLPVPAMIEPGSIQTEQSVSFEAQLPPGSSGLRTQIAKDAGFLDVIAERVEGDGITQFDGLEDGRYFVRARAISARGIEGLSEVHSFRRKRLGVTPEVAPSPLADGFLFAWAAEGEGQSYFAFQLWDTRNPQQLLVDEVGLGPGGLILSGLAEGTYEWRAAAVQADAEDGLMKVWGPTQSLAVTD